MPTFSWTVAERAILHVATPTRPRTAVIDDAIQLLTRIFDELAAKLGPPSREPRSRSN